MAEHLHLVAVDESDFGYSLTSPQIPGLAFGAESGDKLLTELPGVLALQTLPRCPR